jgi:uncharacterized membrane protein
MRIRLAIWFESLRSRLWFIPALFAGGAALAAIIMVTIDRTLGPDATGPFQFGGGPESARSILSTIAAAMLSFTGLVFSVTMLVLQLASSQLSPRVTRTFLRDRKNQAVLGVFVATFVYALLVLREVRSVSDSGFVPSIAVWWSFILLIASIVAFIYYIHHMAHAMRASTVIASVAAETRAAIERRYPDPVGSEPVAALPVSATSATILGPDRPGVVQAIDVARLRRLATDSGTVLEALVQVGDAIPGGAPIASVHGDGRVDADAVRDAFTVGDDRTMDQDPSFGLRQLVDIADRALSPGINDPTTARQVVDQLHDLLRRLAVRHIPSPQRVDDDGALRVIVPGPDWADHVALAIDEIRTYGSGSIQVVRALRRMLDDLESIVPDDRRAATRRQRGLLPPDPADA